MIQAILERAGISLPRPLPRPRTESTFLSDVLMIASPDTVGQSMMGPLREGLSNARPETSFKEDTESLSMADRVLVLLSPNVLTGPSLQLVMAALVQDAVSQRDRFLFICMNHGSSGPRTQRWREHQRRCKMR